MKYAGRVIYDPYFELSEEAANALTGKPQIEEEVGEIEDWETIADFMEQDADQVVTFIRLEGTEGSLKMFLKFDPEDLSTVNLFIPENQEDYPAFEEFQSEFFSDDPDLDNLNDTAETFLHGQPATED